MTIPHITIEQAKIMFSAVEANMKLANELIDKANAEQSAQQTLRCRDLEAHRTTARHHSLPNHRLGRWLENGRCCMTTQEAFENAFPHRDLTQDLEGVYVALSTRVHYKDFCLVYEPAVKAALEEAIAIAKTMRDFYGKPAQPLSANEIVNSLERLIK